MKKYLILIPLFIGLISLFFFSAAYKEIEKEQYKQKVLSTKDKIELISIQIDQFVEDNHDWGYYPYEEKIKAQIEYIDSQYMIYATLYNKDFNIINERKATDVKKPFNPMNYPEFKEAINKNDSGSIIVEYNDGIRDYNEMNLYYKWIPTGDYQNEYLIVAGVTPYADAGNIASWIAYGVIGLIGSLIILQIWMVIRISSMIDTEKHIKNKLNEVNEYETS